MPSVLQLIESWGPGGAETIFVEISSRMRRHGWTTLPAVPRKGWLSRKLHQRGVDTILTGEDYGHGWDVRYLMRLVSEIRQNEVDIVHTHLFGSALYGGLAASICRIPTVSTFHGHWDLREATGYRRIKIPIVNRLCDRIVFVSEPLQHTCLEEFGLDPERSTVIANGIDTSRFRPRDSDDFRDELALDENDFLVGAIGNVRPAKNHEMLLRVAADLAEDVEGIHFVLVGDHEGQGFERLCRERSRAGLEDRVHFVGFREDVERVLNSLDAYVLTSDSEGFSLTTVQAMASAVPVVATRCGGPEVLIEDGRTGFLVDREDHSAMADVLDRLRADPKLRAHIGKEARAEAERRYSVTRMVEQYEYLYRDVLEASENMHAGR